MSKARNIADIGSHDVIETDSDGVTITGDLTIPDKIVHTGDTNTAIRFPAADTVTVETAGSERVKVDSSGNVLCGSDGGGDIGSSTKRFKDLYLSGGVYLGGTGAANYLDDYEEGTWTPTLVGSTTNPSATATAANTGFYTKVGRLVTATFRVDYDSISGGSGDFRVYGLPFNTMSGSQHRSSGNVSFFRGVVHGGNRLAPHAMVSDSGFTFYQQANTTEFDIAVSVGDLSSSVNLHGFITYLSN